MRSNRWAEEEREEESFEKVQLHRYRAGWREFIYERARANPHPGQGWVLITFTLQDAEINGTVISDHDPKYLRDKLAYYADGSSVSGFTVLEFGKRGAHRIHAHMLADGGLYPRQLAEQWRRSNLGFVVVSEVSDLLGAVAYLTKSIGPESLFAAHGRYKGVPEWHTEGGSGGQGAATSAAGKATGLKPATPGVVGATAEVGGDGKPAEGNPRLPLC